MLDPAPLTVKGGEEEVKQGAGLLGAELPVASLCPLDVRALVVAIACTCECHEVAVTTELLL